MKKTLSKLLIDRGMTVTELAKKTGISYNTIMNIGKKDISFSKMEKIADVLDVSLDKFRKDNT
ncbi:transcriptional regulator [Streptococcus gallolyticus subsp. gallolyticus]|uniref:helix-turn-helix domain-containing protein n=1 Tax=Streptococcus gallolyticus TaxID=315405 RepID=UPI0007E4C313|nr:helix-turn-helix transcriptional regulator [Streptococcus gallolyticus]OAV82331.1 transcriptional regulator [Streptococcus gallolyticus subsp. gallolyticus]OCW49759.1 transcriptional regulator [Streptococcus gallolyticus subsp. gallolyticus]